MTRIDGTLYLSLALLLLLMPLKWVLAAAIAVFVHEFCHLAVLCFLGGYVRDISVAPAGCMITADLYGNKRQFFSILAGPLGSFTLLLFRCTFPELAICGLFHGIYNLLPIRPLDGGRLLQIILLRIIPGKAETILAGIRNSCCILLIICGIYLVLRNSGNYGSIVIFAVLSIIRLTRKTPCKAAKSKVQ